MSWRDHDERQVAKLVAHGKCPHMCFGHGNPPAGLPCGKRIIHGDNADGQHCRIHQPGYKRPTARVPLYTRLLEARALFEQIVAECETARHVADVSGGEGLRDLVSSIETLAKAGTKT